MTDDARQALKDRIAALPPEKRQALVEQLRQRGARQAEGAIPRRAPHEPGSSFAQDRFWFVDQLLPGSPIYNIKAAAAIRGPLVAGALQGSLAWVIARHEVLRTTFDSSAGRAVARVHDRLHVDLAVEDLTSLPAAERTARAASLLAEEARRPFDLARGPLLRALLVRLDSHDHHLLVTLHHAVSDGWSAAVLLHELAAGYRSALTGEPLQLPPLAIQYGDFAAWQRRALSPERIEALLAHWTSHLAGAPSHLPLPYDRAPREERRSRGRTVLRTLPGPLVAGLRALAASAQTTLFNALLAGFTAMLSRVTGAEDVVVGTAVAARDRMELEPLIGCFVNLLVLRSDLSGDPTFLDLLARTGRVTSQALEHGELPFERLVEALGRTGGYAGGAHPPLFNVAFIHDNTPLAESRLGDLAFSPLHVDDGMATLDLSVSVGELPGGLRLAIELDTDRFELDTIDAMMDVYEGVLNSAVQAPTARLRSLPIPAAEAAGAVEAMRWTPAEAATAPGTAPAMAPETVQVTATATVPETVTVIDLWRAQAARAPGAMAASVGGQFVSYDELRRRGDQLAGQLRSSGIGPETVVALAIERGIDLAVALWGVLGAGAVALPLDLSLPADRVSWLIADSGAACVLRAPIAPGRAENPLPVRIAPAGAAYLIYTSGSTGRPKGVVVSHAALLNHARAIACAYELTPADRVLQQATPVFDVALEEMVPTWAAGACVVFRDDDTLSDADAFSRFVRRERLTVLNIPTAFWSGWVDGARDGHLSVPSCVRLVVIGGEAAAPDRVALWTRCSRVPLVNAYGPTEATITSVLHRFEPGAWEGAQVPIGRPIANVRAYVLDAEQRAVARGVIGELTLAGEALARGYLGRPGLTAERFLPDPFAARAGERMYRTGDRVRLHANGQLSFLGRLDDQMKIRGHRIEPEEIEQALREHPGIREAAVAARRTPTGHDALVAYLVPRGEPDAIAPRELRVHLERRLPRALVPLTFVWLPALPLTPAGKLDRRALPAPSPSALAPPEPGGAAGSRVEQVLARAWREVLGVVEVGPHDNFFDLGGDSIQAMQVVSRARAHGIRLRARQIIEHPALHALASAVERAQTAAAEPDELAGEAPLLPIQRWFFEQRFARPELWNMSVLLALGPGVGPADVEAALGAITAHHAALRTRFVRDGESWRAEIVSPRDVRVPLAVHDAAERGAAQVAAQVANELHRSLDLGRPPLLAAAFLDAGSARGAELLLVAHHLVVDGVSWRVLIEDLATALGQLAEREQPALPPVATSAARYARWLIAAAEQGALDTSVWEADEPGSAEPLPRDASGGPNDIASARAVTVKLTAEETHALSRDAARSLRARPDELVLTALVAALERWLGRPDHWIDMESHGREELFEDADLSRTVGWLTSLFPVRFRLEGTGAVEHLASVKSQLRRVPQRGLGFGAARYLAGRRIGPDPGPELSFNYLGDLDAGMSFAGGVLRIAQESVGSLYAAEGHRHHVLEVEGAILGGELAVTFTFSENLHRPETIERVASIFAGSLRALLAAGRTTEVARSEPSDYPLADISLRQLDLLGEEHGPPEDLYPLTPLQEGMLFHSLQSPEAGEYLEQVSCRMEEAIDAAVLRQAIRRAVGRNPVLRTSFCWRGLRAPLQFVHAAFDPPWVEIDLASVTRAEQEAEAESEPERAAARAAERDTARAAERDTARAAERDTARAAERDTARAAERDTARAAEREAEIERHVRREQRRGFALDRSPPLRVFLFRLGPARFHLLLSYHHLLLDGWSVPLLLDEIDACYRALVGGAPLPPAAAPFREAFVHRARRAGRAAGESDRFWRDHLAGYDSPVGVPGDRGGAGASSYDERALHLTPAETAGLEDLARRLHVTVSAVVHAAFAILLARHADREDLVFGTVVSGRPPDLDGVERILGNFLATVPLRVRLDGCGRVDELIARLHRSLADAQEHADLRLVHVQRLAELPPGTPLFENVLVVDSYPGGDASLSSKGGGRWSCQVRSRQATGYPLHLLVVPGNRPEAQIELRFTFRSERIDGGDAQRLLQRMSVLLAAMRARPEQAITELDVLGAEERCEVLTVWNRTDRDYPRERTFVDLFADQALRTPGAIALSWPGGRLTYSELAERTRGVAAALAERGIGSEEVVVVLDERGPDLACAILGALRAGCAYLPLAPDHPVARMAQILSVARPRAAIAGERFRAALAATGYSFGAVVDASARGDDTPPPPRPGRLAYVIYTSGSTGVPKGAMVEHRGMLNHLYAKLADLELTCADVVAQTASQCFDISVWQLLVALLVGGRSHILPDEVAHDPGALLDAVERDHVTILEVVPSMLRAVLDEAARRARRPPLSGVRWVIATGEALPPDLCGRWFEAYPAIPLMNAYGPTECSDDVTHFAMAAAPSGGTTPIGRPIQNTRLYVMSRDRRLLPAGIAGELWVGGEGVGRGYLREPSRTAEVFVPDPFSREPGARLYRTGDLARWRLDGTLEFLGRIDHQVKIRGFRIELGEIELALRAQPGVADAVVIAREDGSGDKQLVGYLVAGERVTLDTAAIQRALAAALPDYMVPSALMVLDALPLTANGKLDRRALPAPSPPIAELVAPRSPVEEAVAQIWCEVLGADRLGVTDDFFAVGGHSLLATQVASRIREAYRVELPLATLFRARTIAALSLAIEEAVRSEIDALSDEEVERQLATHGAGPVDPKEDA